MKTINVIMQKNGKKLASVMFSYDDISGITEADKIKNAEDMALKSFNDNLLGDADTAKGEIVEFEDPICIVDSHAGIYTPAEFKHRFSERLAELVKEGVIEAEDVEEISTPDNEFYWESFELIEENFFVISEGKRFFLFQDGDLFLMEEGYPNEEDFGIFDMERE